MDILQAARKRVNKLCKIYKQDYYKDKIKTYAGNKKELYSISQML